MFWNKRYTLKRQNTNLRGQHSWRPRLEVLENRLALSGGNLDTSFDGDGKVTSNIYPEWSEVAMDVAVQSTGMVIAAGTASKDGKYDPMIVRYDQFGNIDLSFGGNGDGSAFYNLSSRFGVINSVAIDSLDRIYIAGYVRRPTSLSTMLAMHDDFLIIRFDASGFIDSSFGVNGVVTTNFSISGFSESEERINDLVIDGTKLVAAGWSRQNSSDDYDMAVARYNLSDGSADTTFNSNGRVVSGLSGNDLANAVATRDGKVTAVGYSDGYGYDTMLALRYNSNGSLSGIRYVEYGAKARAEAVAIQDDGKVVIAGYSYADSSSASKDFAVVRLKAADFGLDTSFGLWGTGKVRISFGSDPSRAFGVAIQSDGKIVVGGTVDTTTPNFGLTRLTSTGLLDTGFGSNGLTVTTFGASDYAMSMAIQPADGKIILAGYSNITGENSFAVARYHDYYSSVAPAPMPGDLEPISLEQEQYSTTRTSTSLLSLDAVYSAQKTQPLQPAAGDLVYPPDPVRDNQVSMTTTKTSDSASSSETTSTPLVTTDPWAEEDFLSLGQLV